MDYFRPGQGGKISSARTLLVRGMSRGKTGDTVGALQDFIQVTQMAPGFGYAFKRAGRLQAQLGDIENARIALAAASA